MIVFLPIYFLMCIALCLPAWLYAHRQKRFFVWDILTLLFPLISIFWISGYDDDGAGTIAMMILFPIIILMTTYLRVFLLGRYFIKFQKSISILMLLLLGLIMPVMTSLYVKHHYYEPCKHCLEGGCIQICGG